MRRNVQRKEVGIGVLETLENLEMLEILEIAQVVENRGEIQNLTILERS